MGAPIHRNVAPILHANPLDLLWSNHRMSHAAENLLGAESAETRVDGKKSVPSIEALRSGDVSHDASLREVGYQGKNESNTLVHDRNDMAANAHTNEKHASQFISTNAGFQEATKTTRSNFKEQSLDHAANGSNRASTVNELMDDTDALETTSSNLTRQSSTQSLHERIANIHDDDDDDDDDDDICPRAEAPKPSQSNHAVFRSERNKVLGDEDVLSERELELSAAGSHSEVRKSDGTRATKQPSLNDDDHHGERFEYEESSQEGYIDAAIDQVRHDVTFS
jgi:hypothetical protein